MSDRLSDEAPCWREAAMARALRAEEMGGEAEYALVRAIRESLPESPTLSINIPSASRYRVYLTEPGRGAWDLLPAEHSRLSRWDGLCSEVSWHGMSHEGARFEVAVFPGGNRGRGFGAIAIGRGGAGGGMLREFAEDLRSFCDRPSGRTLLYSASQWRADETLEAEVARTSWEDVVLPAGQASEIRSSVEGFFGRRASYRRMGVAWRRGVLLVGPPGTGKTLVCKAVAASLPDHPFLYVRDLSGYDTQEEIIADVFGRARELAPATLVFEDIDGFVNDSNRAVFLNELDGVRSNEGLLVLASSNHPERVDEALLKRPSRFDRVFHIGLPGESERREYCRRLLLRPELLEQVGGREGAGNLAEKVAKATGGFTPAYLQEAFVSAALEIAHGDDEGELSFAERVTRHVETLRSHISQAQEPERFAEMRDPSQAGPGFTA